MEIEGQLLLKIVAKNGQAYQLFASEATVAEMSSHPKFVQMHDSKNVIFMSLDDVTAFEITNYREPETETPAVSNA